jgi:hypothetical protein
MRGKIAVSALLLALAASVARAQGPTNVPVPAAMYCSGIVSSDAVPRDTYVITGEESRDKITFQQGGYVYINKGSGQGVKAGDEFLAVRAVTDPGKVPWFHWQGSLIRAMGTVWEDEGRLRVVVAQPNVSTAQIVESCNYMQRGDVIVPFAERSAPALKPENNFDRFAPPSGHAEAMVVTSKRFQVEVGTNDVAYINLGSAQGVKVGDYFRIFRYQGVDRELAFQTWKMAFDVYGYGSAPRRYNWKDVPREIIGEGVVVRVAPKSSTVLITYTVREIYAGDYAELE